MTYVGPVPPLRGGIAQHGARLIEALRSGGHEVRTHSWRRQYPGPLYPGPERDPSAAAPTGTRFDLAWYDPASWRRAGGLAKRSDLLVLPWVSSFQALPYRVLLGSASPTPGVLVVHNPLPHERRRLDVPLTRMAFRAAVGAVVHAATSERELRTLAPHLTVVQVPMPSMLQLVPTAVPESPPYRLLFLGFVRPYKGLDVAIEALRLLVAEGVDATLTVAGLFWGKERPWREAISRAGLSARVDVLSRYLTDREVAAALESHHLVVAPYRTATQSGIVPTVQAAGRTVVATAVGGLVEQVSDGVDGVLVTPGDPTAFADAIKGALRRLPELSTAAAARAPRWDAVAEAVLKAAE